MKFQIQSMNPKTPGVSYEVTRHQELDKSYWWSCECPHWMIRLQKTRRACKHIDEAKQRLRNQEKLQAEIATQFQVGDGADWDTHQVKPDLYEDDEGVPVDSAR